MMFKRGFMWQGACDSVARCCDQPPTNQISLPLRWKDVIQRPGSPPHRSVFSATLRICRVYHDVKIHQYIIMYLYVLYIYDIPMCTYLFVYIHIHHYIITCPCASLWLCVYNIIILNILTITKYMIVSLYHRIITSYYHVMLWLWILPKSNRCLCKLNVMIWYLDFDSQMTPFPSLTQPVRAADVAWIPSKGGCVSSLFHGTPFLSRFGWRPCCIKLKSTGNSANELKAITCKGTICI